MIFVNHKRIIQDSGVIKDPTTYWYIEKYVYGVLKETVEIPLGTSVTFGSIDSGYSDDTFYGWSIGSTSVTVNFASTNTGSNLTKTIKNNLDDENTLKLYAVYKYSLNKNVQEILTENVDIGGKAATLTVTGATSGTSYTVYISTPHLSQGSNRYTDRVEYFISSSATTTILTTGTVDSTGTITYSFSAGSTTSGTFTVGSSSATSTPTRVTVTASEQGVIEYKHTKTVTGTYYRVISHNGNCTVNIYSYGLKVKTLSAPEGLPITLGSVTSIYDDDTFYGYSTSSTSTTKSYSDTNSVTPRETLNLYAIYSYSTEGYESGKVSFSGNIVTTKEFTLTTGTINLSAIRGWGSASGSGGQEEASFSTAYPINNTSSGTNSMSISAYIYTPDKSKIIAKLSGTNPTYTITSSTTGYILHLAGVGYSGSTSGSSYEVTYNVPTYVTAYRVSSHS